MTVLESHVGSCRPLSYLINSEVFIALGVVSVLIVMIISLPPLMLDMLLASPAMALWLGSAQP